jgi:1-deoxy-D-xylulose-5-phosphate synthase
MKILPSISSPADVKALPIEDLPALAADIREAIIDQVSRSGGHLAPNLGVVELSIALHYVFDFAHDRLLLDVGHQCYPHKLLTGRLPMLEKLRTREGMAGFPEPSESPYDLFRVGHAGTAISTAVGLAKGDQLRGESFDPEKRPDGRRVVALVGDASIVNGVAMEGLNSAGTLNRQFLVVLNDNGMSIGKPQGAMAKSFDRMRLSSFYGDLKKQAKSVLKQMPGGSLLQEAYHRAGEATKQWIPEAGERSWFEHFGLVAVGPIDGHEIPELIGFLREAKSLNRPMVLHVKTIKGKGLEAAEGDATTFHSPPSFRVEGCRVELKKKGRSFTAAFADAMQDILASDEKVVAATAAMPDGTGLARVIPEFPDRVWDTGICESHAMDMMAGCAKAGLRPFFAVYSTFLQRAFDQAFQEVALQELPVRLCLDRAGVVGGDGAVHHGFCDVAILRALPGSVLTAAIDEPSLRAALEFMRTHDDGLSAVRYPRDVVADRFAGDDCPPFKLGEARHLLRVGDGSGEPDVAVLAYGVVAHPAAEALERLAEESDLTIDLYDARFAKPVDEALVTSLAESGVPMVTIEDHTVIGGFGSAVLEAASEVPGARVVRLGLPDRWILQSSRALQLEEAGLDAGSIAAAVRDAAAGRGPDVRTVQPRFDAPSRR